MMFMLDNQMFRLISSSLLAAILILVFSACSNAFKFTKDPLFAWGQKFNNDEYVSYYSISIDFDKSGFEELPSLIVKLPGDTRIKKLDELTPEYVDQYLQAYKPPEEWPEYVKLETLERLSGYEVYKSDGVYLSFKDNNISFVGLCTHCEGKISSSAMIGNASTGTLYQLPLTEQQMIEIFGDPESVKKYNEVYY